MTVGHGVDVGIGVYCTFIYKIDNVIYAGIEGPSIEPCGTPLMISVLELKI